jgi:hypothetical protein
MQPKLFNSQTSELGQHTFVNWKVLAAFDDNMPTNFAGL